MRYGLISDIHANLEALEAVLKQLEEVEGCICLGDLVGYGPNPNECVEIIRKLPNLVCIAGNHDLAAVGKYDLTWFNPFARQAIEWTARQLTPENIKFLLSLETIVQHPPFTLVHGSLPDPMEYVMSPFEARQVFAEMSTQVCLIGHSHIAEYYRQRDGTRLADRFCLVSGGEVRLDGGYRHLINIGSVGQPRDGSPKAAFGLWEEETKTISIFRLRYDMAKTQRKMEQARLPDYLIQRLSKGR
jgi:predicted phosphodiesterase